MNYERQMEEANLCAYGRFNLPLNHIPFIAHLTHSIVTLIEHKIGANSQGHSVCQLQP